MKTAAKAVQIAKVHLHVVGAGAEGEQLDKAARRNRVFKCGQDKLRQWVVLEAVVVNRW